MRKHRIRDGCSVSNSRLQHLNNYFDFQVCLSIRPSVHPWFCPFVVPSVRKLTSIPAVLSQNVTNQSYLECFESEKFAFCITPVPLGPRCTQGGLRGSTSKFTKSKKFVNKNCFVYFTNDKICFIGGSTYFLASGELLYSKAFKQ